jgi:hypothetical protein
MSLTAPERETIIRLNDEDELANVWTAQRPWITKLKKNPAATLLDEGSFEGSVWAEFEVPASLLTVRSKKVTLQLTDGQRRQRADRLRTVKAENA